MTRLPTEEAEAPTTDANPDILYTNLRTVYDQLCNSYRALDDFHMKLLGFLPLATGGVILLIFTASKLEFTHYRN